MSHIRLTIKNSDHNGPVLDIYWDNSDEAFEIGRLFADIAAMKKCVWQGPGSIRVPLINMSKIGTAELEGD